MIRLKRVHAMLSGKRKMLHLLFGSRCPPNSKKTLIEVSVFTKSHGSLIVNGHPQIHKVI